MAVTGRAAAIASAEANGGTVKGRLNSNVPWFLLNALVGAPGMDLYWDYAISSVFSRIFRFVVVGKRHFTSSFLSAVNVIRSRASKLQFRRTLMRRKVARTTLVIAFVALIWAAIAVSAAAQSLPGAGTVMTYNVNEGTDFLQAVGTTSLTEFLLGVGQILTQVQGTNPPERMQAVARQILSAQPELLSLQEVDQWYTGTFDTLTGTCGTMTLQYDMVQELLSALAAQGGHYEVAVQVTQNAFPPTPGLIPPADYVCVAVTDYNIILARTDLPSWVFQWSNPQSGQYINQLAFPTPVGTLPYPRAWASVDVQFFGHPFLYINTHLESFDAGIRELQGDELRAGPANSSLPVIIAMDSNAQAFPLPQDPTYVDFISAGYDDVWSRLFPKRAGLTCCQDEADNNSVSQLYQRIDLVLTLGKIKPWGAVLIGNNPRSRLPDGLWPSDHAALVVGVVVGNN
jgi:endonuclease/exonuclease/phosphatase family metal-dependent hydrolase